MQTSFSHAADRKSNPSFLKFPIINAKTFLFILLLLSFGEIGAAQSAKPEFNRTRTFDVQHYLIRTSFDRKSKTIFGDTTITLKPLNKDFKSVELDAANLNFEFVKLEPADKDLDFKTDDDKIIIELGKKYSPKDVIKIRLKYSAKPKKGVYFVNAETNGGIIRRDAQIWTQGEAAEAHYWFPSYDFPDDKATSEQFITVDAGETAISNGELLERLQNTDGTQTFHYKMNLPHATYLISFIVGKYLKVSDIYKNIPLGIYLYPGKEELAKTAFGNTREMMRIFEELTGIGFPFNKYDQTIVNHFSFGGMENITATTFSDAQIFFSDINKSVVEDVVSHELAHSWFGNLVTCRNWSELWLNEGFATFMEAAYREKMYGRDDYLRKIKDDSLEYFAEEVRTRQKHGLFNQFARPDDDIFDAVAYQKGGNVIHMLRETVGDKAFWKAVNIYLNKYKFGSVETKDLEKVFEDVSKKDLKWFFDQWVYGTGYPNLVVKYRYDAATKMLTLNIEQVQDTEDSTIRAFLLPLDVEITTANGIVNEKVTISKSEESFSFKIADSPTSLILDKGLKIPLKKVRISKDQIN